MCDYTQETALFAVDALDDRDKERFSRHMETCPECRNRARQLQDVYSVLTSLPPEPRVRDMAPDILAIICRKKQTGNMPGNRFLRFFPYASRIAAVTAVLALMCFFGWYLFGRKGSLSGTSPAPASAEYGSGHTAFGNVSPTVNTALEWLASAQNETGEWETQKWGGKPDYRVGVTSLAVLALLSGGEYSTDHRFAIPLGKGIDYILANQSPKGRFGPSCRSAPYNHGIATVALLEYYEIRRAQKLKEPIQRALGYIRFLQTDEGGWGYLESGFAGSVPNTSITVWQLEALILGANLGFTDCGKPYARGLAWLSSMVDEKGIVWYRKPSDRTLNTSGTLSGMVAFSASGNKELIKERIGKFLEDIPLPDGSNPDYYRWYALTYGLYAADRTRYDTWHAHLETMLAGLQETKGPTRGSWNPADQWGSAGGRVYATSMAVLALQTGERANRIAGYMRLAQY